MATTINAGTATGGAAISADTTGILALQSGSTPTTAITVDTSQNVGIGTTSPGFKLDIKTAAVTPAIQWSDNVNSTGFLSTAVGGSSINSNTTLIFGVGTSSPERMRINSSGNLLINRTTGIYADTKFEVKGAATSTAACLQIGTDGYAAWSWRNVAGSEVGYIAIGASSTSYATSSDYRLKENIAPMTGALSAVAQLKPVTYDWKAGGSSQGFIAHELAEVCPQAVVGEKDAVETIDDLDADGKVIGTKEIPKYQGIDTSFLVATLTAAIQELNAKVDAQAAEIKALKGVA